MPCVFVNWLGLAFLAPAEYHNKHFERRWSNQAFGSRQGVVVSLHPHLYLVDIEVLRHDAPTAVSEIEADKDGVRFGLDTPTADVINDLNFYSLAVVVNTIEVPYRTVTVTRTDMGYTVNQDYYNKMPVMTSDDGHGNAAGLLTEAQLRKLCDIMYTFASR